jgi:hypothetical protein
MAVSVLDRVSPVAYEMFELIWLLFLIFADAIPYLKTSRTLGRNLVERQNCPDGSSMCEAFSGNGCCTTGGVCCSYNNISFTGRLLRASHLIMVIDESRRLL